MKTYTVTVHFDHTISQVQIKANSPAEAKRLAESQYAGKRIGNVTESR
jgi:capsule polysaccharide export protein KpsE/RkpR